MESGGLQFLRYFMSISSLKRSQLPLNGILVLDFSQFLAGPVAAMRLGDLGARVIKVERPGTGDIGRTLAFAGLEKDGDTLSFHIMNRNKESYAADLKDSDGLKEVRELVKRADVIIQNFRPGVIERLGLGYEEVKKINPKIIYGSATGYGTEGPLKDRPGQDLLAQSLSGLPWLSGRAGDPPIPVGLALADIFTSTHLASGVIALLLRRERTGVGGVIETSLLESMLDLQFELISANLFDPNVVVNRGTGNSAHAFLPAPYGLYETSNGYLAIAMTPIPALGLLLDLDLAEYEDPKSWWINQEVIMKKLSAKLEENSTEHWLAILDAADIWCAPVLTLSELVSHEGFTAIDMTQRTERTGRDGSEISIPTTRSPIRIDGKTIKHSKGAPHVGEDTEKIRKEFGI